MANPYGATQGFDERAGEPSDVAQGAARYPYDAALNVEPAANGGAAITWAAGETKTIVKAISRTDVSTGAYAVIQDYLVISILPSGGFTNTMLAPGPADPTAPCLDTAAMDLSIFRQEARPAGFPTAAELEAILPPLVRPHFMGWEHPLNLRRLQTFRHYADGATAPNYVDYSADIATWESMRFYSLHYLTAEEQRTQLLIVMRRAADTLAAIRRGYAGGCGAGMWHDMGVCELTIAALVLGRRDLLDAAQTLGSNTFGHPYMITAEDEGIYIQPVAPSGNNQRYDRTPFAHDVGKPFWSELRSRRIVSGAQPSARYSTISLVAGAIEAFPVLLCGTSAALGEDGISAVINAQPIASAPSSALATSTRDGAGILAVFDRIKVWGELQRGFNYTFAEPLSYTTAIEAWRHHIPTYGWTGLPDSIDKSGITIEAQNTFVSTAGGVSWNTDDAEWNGNQAVLDRRVSLSRDAKQWVDYNGQPAIGSLATPTVGEPIYAAIAQRNAAGWGPRSLSNPFAADDETSGNGPRNFVTPTATGAEVAAAPASIAAPALMVLQYPGGGTEHFIEIAADAELSALQTRLWIGGGLHSAHPAATTTFTLQYEQTPNAEDWTDVGDGQDWPLGEAPVNLTGKRLRGRKVTQNAGGTLTEYTGVCRVPEAELVVPGTVIDLSFAGFDPIHYLDQWAYLGVNATAVFVHNPNLPFEGVVVGGIIAEKAGQRPGIEITIPASDAAAGTYQIDLSVIAGLDPVGLYKGWGDPATPIQVAIYDAPGGTLLYFDDATLGPPHVSNDDPENGEVQSPIRGVYGPQVTTPGGLYISIVNDSSTGGGAFGDPVLEQVRIVSV